MNRIKTVSLDEERICSILKDLYVTENKGRKKALKSNNMSYSFFSKSLFA